jgi:hypothetical protein
MKDQKQLENVESFKYLGSMLTNYGIMDSTCANKRHNFLGYKTVFYS